MKKIICLITILIASLAVSFGLIACEEGPKTYTIDLIVDENTVLEETSFKATQGKAYTLPTPTKEGYAFDGWYDEDGDKIDIQGSWTYGKVKLTANFNAQNYNLYVNVDGGTKEDGTAYPSILSFTYDSQYTLEQPKKTGYTFDGWKKGTADFQATGIWKIANNNSTITAKWTVNSYKVNFEVQDGVEASLLKTEDNFVYDSSANEFAGLEYDEEMYKLEGWRVKGTDTLLKTMPKWNYAEEITLVAEFSLIEYTISFEDMKGEQLPIKGNKGQSVELPNPSKTGYILVKYTCNGNDVDLSEEYVITGDAVLKGVWIEKEFNVVLDAGENGTLSSTKFKATYNVTKFSDIPAPTANAGQEFTGWSYNGRMLEGDALWDIDATDITLVANYKGETYLFSFVTSEGTLKDETISLTFGNTYELKALDSTELKRFKYWTFNGEKVEASGIWNIDPEDKDAVFVAVWEDKTTKLTFKTNYGGPFNEITVKLGDEVQLYEIEDTLVINNNLYTFGGWSYNGVQVETGDVWNFDVSEAELTAIWLKDTNWSDGIRP